MKSLSRSLCERAVSLRYEQLSNQVLEKAKHLILDTVGVALGGYLCEPSHIVREVVRQMGGTREATIIATGEKTSSSLAALVNCVMVRYLDFMDFYFNKDICHPSENIPTALAVGESLHATGKQVLEAIIAGFEVQGRLADTFPCGDIDWHHTTMGGYVTPIVAGKLLNLSEDQMVSAVGLAGCTGHTIRFYEPGVQSTHMKAIAYGIASQRGIQAATMANLGMTGPERALEIMNQVLGFHVENFDTITEDRPPRILEACIKPYASEFMSHTAIDAILAITQDNSLKEEDIDSIEVKTYQTAVQVIAAPKHWAPKTRETADHSLPYCLAIAVIEGKVGPEQFQRHQWETEQVKRLISKIRVKLDESLNELYPACRPMDLTVTAKDGRKYNKRVDYSKGDSHNPMTDGEIKEKFIDIARKVMSDRQLQQIIEQVDRFEELNDVGVFMQLLTV